MTGSLVTREPAINLAQLGTSTSVQVALNGTSFSLEIARTPAELQRGLMGRSILKPNTGMLFIFPQQEKYCFWMKNTFVPLDLLFLDAQGKVVQTVTNMSPRSLKRHCPRASIAGAIEVPSGTLKKIGIQSGDVVPNFQSLRERISLWKKD